MIHNVCINYLFLRKIPPSPMLRPVMMAPSLLCYPRTIALLLWQQRNAHVTLRIGVRHHVQHKRSSQGNMWCDRIEQEYVVKMCIIMIKCELVDSCVLILRN